MDFRQLEAFVQVVRQGSFSRAAEQLFLTQPTVSSHIKALERELGTQLIIRTTKDALPSEAGVVLYDYAVSMLSTRDSAVEACRSRAGQCGGTVSLAASTVPYRYVLPAAMAAFRTENPEIRFDLIGSDSAGVVSEVLKGRVELGLCGTETEHPQLAYEAILQDELVVVTPPQEPFLSMQGKGHDVQDFIAFPFVMREAGSGTRREAEAALIRWNVQPQSLRVAAQMDSPDAILTAVGHGLGISIVSQLSCAEDARLGRLCVFRLGREAITRSLYLVYPKKRPLAQASAAFLQFMRERAI